MKTLDSTSHQKNEKTLYVKVKITDSEIRELSITSGCKILYSKSFRDKWNDENFYFNEFSIINKILANANATKIIVERFVKNSHLSGIFAGYINYYNHQININSDDNPLQKILECLCIKCYYEKYLQDCKK